MVREGDWKLLGNPRDRSEMAPLGKDDKLYLVNMADDVKELTNLAKKHPEVVKRLSSKQQNLLNDIEGK